jgi:hypothetical protein
VKQKLIEPLSFFFALSCVYIVHLTIIYAHFVHVHLHVYIAISYFVSHFFNSSSNFTQPNLPASFIYRALSSYFVKSYLNLVHLFIFSIHSIPMYILTSSCIFSLSFFQFPLFHSILVHNAFSHSVPLSSSNFIGLYDYPLGLLYAYSSSCIFFSHVCCLCHLSMKLNVHKNLSSGNDESWWAKEWKWV